MRSWPSIRSLAASAALVAGVAALSSCAPGANSASASSEPAGRVVQCESGVVNVDDSTQISSATAERVPNDSALPKGCYWAG